MVQSSPVDNFCFSCCLMFVVEPSLSSSPLCRLVASTDCLGVSLKLNLPEKGATPVQGQFSENATLIWLLNPPLCSTCMLLSVVAVDLASFKGH